MLEEIKVSNMSRWKSLPVSYEKGHIGKTEIFGVKLSGQFAVLKKDAQDGGNLTWKHIWMRVFDQQSPTQWVSKSSLIVKFDKASVYTDSNCPIYLCVQGQQ